MPDLAVSNDTEIIRKVQKTAEILMIFKVHAYGEQTVYSRTQIMGFARRCDYKPMTKSRQLFLLKCKPSPPNLKI